jgi:hypothetical protein
MARSILAILLRLGPLGLLGLAVAGCSEGYDIGMLRWPLSAFCTVNVIGKGSKEVETDYLPHVITCENGSADTEALKVQAVAARTYMYYKLASAGSVQDGTGDQVYTCASQPSTRHFDAVKATSGQVLVWSNVVICSFFVAGAKPTTQTCVPLPTDSDPYNTERYVTYNEGKSGSQVTPSSIGSSTSKYNRGCMSQNGSNCLSLKGRRYPEILRFYYGADIQIETATGSCVTPQPQPDARVPDARVGDARISDRGAHPSDGEVSPPAEAGDLPLPALDAVSSGDGASSRRGIYLNGGCSAAHGLPLAGETASGLGLLLLLLASAHLGSRRRGPALRVQRPTSAP